MYKVIVLGAIAAVLAAGLAVWQNNRPIEQAGRLDDLRIRTAALEDIQRQINLFKSRQVETRQIVERLQEEALIQTYADHFRIHRQMATLIYAAATVHQFDPNLVFRIIAEESNFNPSDVSEKGAVGLMQVLPSTGLVYGVDRPSLFDPEINLNVGLLHLRNCLWAENNDLVKALDRYNRGSRPDAQHRYASRILKGESFSY